MSLSLLILSGVLFAAGSYLLMERSLTRIALGVGVLGNSTTSESSTVMAIRLLCAERRSTLNCPSFDE